MTYEEYQQMEADTLVIQELDHKIELLQKRASYYRTKLRMRLAAGGYHGPMPWVSKQSSDAQRRRYFRREQEREARVDKLCTTHEIPGVLPQVSKIVEMVRYNRRAINTGETDSNSIRAGAR